jgi:hypothetical protein
VTVSIYLLFASSHGNFVLVEVGQVELPGTAEEVMRLCLTGSSFTEDFRAVRKDTKLEVNMALY